MTTKTKDAVRNAAKILREHNVWRRGGDEHGEGTFHEPSTIGEAIDTLCAFAERQTRDKPKPARKPATWRDVRANCS